MDTLLHCFNNSALKLLDLADSLDISYSQATYGGDEFINFHTRDTDELKIIWAASEIENLCGSCVFSNPEDVAATLEDVKDEIDADVLDKLIELADCFEDDVQQLLRQFQASSTT